MAHTTAISTNVVEHFMCPEEVGTMPIQHSTGASKIVFFGPQFNSCVLQQSASIPGDRHLDLIENFQPAPRNRSRGSGRNASVCGEMQSRMRRGQQRPRPNSDQEVILTMDPRRRTLGIHTDWFPSNQLPHPQSETGNKGQKSPQGPKNWHWSITKQGP